LRFTHFSARVAELLERAWIGCPVSQRSRSSARARADR
jgi:hypothetical protein